MGYICGLGTEMSDLEAKVEFGKFYNNYKIKVNIWDAKVQKKVQVKRRLKEVVARKNNS